MMIHWCSGCKSCIS